MNLRIISKALGTLNTNSDDDEMLQAVIDIRLQGKDVEYDDELGAFCASGTYTKPASVGEVFERARRYRQ